jgi:hypothetical protein
MGRCWRRIAGRGEREEGRKRFFLKKEAKTFANEAAYCGSAWPKKKKFFGSFFQKRTASFCAPCRR